MQQDSSKAPPTPEQMHKIFESLRPGDLAAGRYRSGSGTGQGFRGDGDSIGKFNLGGIDLPGIGVGQSGIEWSVIAQQGMPVLLVLGGLAILAGAVIGIAAKRPKTGIGLGVGGGALIWLAFMAEEQPELLALGGLLAVALFGWFGWTEWQAAKAKRELEERQARDREALATVVDVVEKLPPGIREQVKGQMKEKVGEHSPVRTTIREVKGVS